MSIASRDLKIGRLVLRIDDENDRHVHLTVFDQGANAGTLVVDRTTFVAIAGEPITGESIPVSVAPLAI